MNIEKALQQRSESTCELCASADELSVLVVEPKSGDTTEECAYVCNTCQSQIDQSTETDPNHWRCLNDSMWNTHPAVQVLAWRMLSRLKSEGWPQDLLDMLYLEEDTLAWAKATGEGEEESDKIVHKDSNGAILAAGDSVVLIKDLNVKGANFTAKRGTAVRNITLTHDNAEHIEGKVNGQHIVILTKFVKK
ncbi:PhnA domain-containing protein [Reichenbachiella carrageenanivorans]|uniref:PhnA domain-containing protein n=1 Tax=Reichenbachiella carrageenanivorans TaxID=2979869 RepID=A0ABY6D0H2_9BACT|nr:alkylphosphonate utilization protein [Reichenbachiella carrageenanivorans]UXX79675.1 PhnA domain-containing protein [Reichenbachiella carrageenanivorans]